MESKKFSLTAATISAADFLRKPFRKFQGIPGVETLDGKNLFVVWYANDEPGEGPGNYVILARSSDNALSWREVLHIVPPDGESRVYDPVIWFDPLGRLWLFWAQCHSTYLWDSFDGKAGVWAAVCNDPSGEELKWSVPRRIADGIMMNKPTVLKDQSWALPVSVWALRPDLLVPETVPQAFPNVLFSRDNGETFVWRRGPDVPERTFDEHMIIEQSDGRLRLFVRTGYGIGSAVSTPDGGEWQDIGDSGLGGPNSRFAVRRLRSGRLCLINHQMPHRLPQEKLTSCRENLTAWLSDDDGASWYGRMLIDGRKDVSYPDFAEAGDGFIYLVHDHDRTGCGEIILSRFKEDDIAAGRIVSPGAYCRMVVSALADR